MQSRDNYTVTAIFPSLMTGSGLRQEPQNNLEWILLFIFYIRQDQPDNQDKIHLRWEEEFQGNKESSL